MTPKQTLAVVERLKRLLVLTEAKIALQATAEDSLIAALFKACPHPLEQLVEAPYGTSEFVPQRPFIVCRLCGYAEEGWGCGYWKFSLHQFDVPRAASREAAYKHVRRLYTQDEIGNLRWPKRKKTDE